MSDYEYIGGNGCSSFTTSSATIWSSIARSQENVPYANVPPPPPHPPPPPPPPTPSPPNAPNIEARPLVARVAEHVLLHAKSFLQAFGHSGRGRTGVICPASQPGQRRSNSDRRIPQRTRCRPAAGPAGTDRQQGTEDSFSASVREFEGRLAKRLWVAITWFDSLNRHAVPATTAATRSFTIHAVGEIPACRPTRVPHLQPDLQLSRQDVLWPNETGDQTRTVPGDLGRNVVPSEFRQFPYLVRVLRKSPLLVDGGLGRLSHSRHGGVGGDVVWARTSATGRGKTEHIATACLALVESGCGATSSTWMACRKVSRCRIGFLNC